MQREVLWSTLTAFLCLVLVFAWPERRPESPDPRRRRAWNASKSTPRPWWRRW